MNLTHILSVLLIAFILIGCDDTPSQDKELRKQETAAINDLQQRKNSVVDIPNLTDFRPADMFARTMEEQDKGVQAYAYMLSPYSEKFFFVCVAAAFPYPGGTQFTAPSITKTLDDGTGVAGWTVPQADPNGLYTPETAAATILPCWANEHDVNNTGNKFESTYFEDNIVVLPGPLPASLVINPDNPFVR